MAMKDRGPQPRPDRGGELARDLKASFRWLGDRTDRHLVADRTNWWADPTVLGRIGPALGDLYSDNPPSVVLGPQSSGSMLGALVAAHLGVGFVELRKDPGPLADSDRWLLARTPPDYKDRNLLLGARREHLRAGQRVLLVDDWIETGGQATAARRIVEQAGATWCGTAVVVDGLSDRRVRNELAVRALLRIGELEPRK